MRWLDGMIDRMDMTLSKLWELMKDREPRLSTIHGVAKSQKQLSDWTIQQELIMMYLDIKLFGSIPFGIHWAVLACSCFWLVAKSYALFEKLLAIIQKKFFWSVFPIQYSVSFTVHQSESATHIHISPFFWISFPFRPSENDRTGNSAIIFFDLLFFIFNFIFNLHWYLPTGPWS